MSGINTATVVGRVGRDPETRYLPDGTAVTNWSMATSYVSKETEYTEWHNIKAFGRSAEIAGEYLHKGDLCGVEGSLQTETWEKDGQKHYKTVIRCNRLHLLGKAGGGQQRDDGEERPRAAAKPAQSPKPAAKPDQQSIADMDDDIPF